MFVQLMQRCWQILLIIVQELQVVFEIMFNVLSEMFGWRGLAVTRWSRSTKLLYVGSG